MARNLVTPQFPIPPQEYEPSYFAEVVRSFAVYLEQYSNPGEERATQITLTELPTDNSGLETGALFNHGGTVKITEANKPFARGAVGTSAVGTVTVTTT